MGKLVTRAVGILEVNEVTGLAAQVEALDKKINGLSLQKSAIIMACDTCVEGHTATDCPIVRDVHRSTEQLDFVGSAL